MSTPALNVIIWLSVKPISELVLDAFPAVGRPKREGDVGAGGGGKLASGCRCQAKS